jgi:hypothetical protein
VTTVHDYLDGVDGIKESVNEAGKLKVGKEDFSFLLKLTDRELVKRLDLIRKQQLINGKQYMTARSKGEDTSKIEKVGENLANQERAVIQARIRLHDIRNTASEAEDLNESTRWQVGTIDKNGNIESAYVHSDGYPEYVKPLLTKHYKDKKKVEDMMKLAKVAGVSFLAPELGSGKQNFGDPDYNISLFYGRDRGEKSKPWATQKGDVKDIATYIRNSANDSSADYVYLYDERDGKWYYASYKDKGLKQL